MKVLKEDWPFLSFLMLVGGYLLFKNLGNIYLWNDEGGTAALARNVMKFGVPRIDDGFNLASEFADGRQTNRWGHDGRNTWGMYYVMAAVFWIFGLTTWAARFPFALMAWVSIPLAYLFYRQCSGSRLVARWGSLLMTTSVIFILHARQARYYIAPVLCLFVVLIGYFMALESGRRRGHVLFCLGSVLLFHFFYPDFLFVLPVLFIHFLFCSKVNRTDRRAWIMDGIVIACLTLPFTIVISTREFSAPSTMNPLYEDWVFKAYLFHINECVFPFLVLPLTVLFLRAPVIKRIAWFVLSILVLFSGFVYLLPVSLGITRFGNNLIIGLGILAAGYLLVKGYRVRSLPGSGRRRREICLLLTGLVLLLVWAKVSMWLFF